MAMPEQYLAGGLSEQPQNEHLDPHHFYAAYVFDNAQTRRRDITVLIDQAQRLERPVRYWWLSEAMDLQDSPDRLIVCVHHPDSLVEVGMDLHQKLERHQATWDELEAAHVDEYRTFGKVIAKPASIFDPDGTPLFPEPETADPALFTLTRDDVQSVAEGKLGRDLSDDEIEAIAELLPSTIDWIASVEAAIEVGQIRGRVGIPENTTMILGQVAGEIEPAAVGDRPEGTELEPPVRELFKAGWSEAFHDASGHVLGKVDVVAGIAADGEIYLRRVWGSATAPPLGFTPHDWGPAFTLRSDDTLDDVLVYLDELVDHGDLLPQERVRSEAYYRRLFSQAM